MSRRSVALALGLSGACALAVTAAAQEVAPADAPAPAATDPDPDRTLTEEEALFLRRHLVTTGARRPQAIARASAATIVVTGAEIRESGAQTLADVLRFVAGVSVLRLSAADAAVNIRGLNTPGNPELMLLIDGRPAPLEFFGVTLWDHLPVPLDAIDRIEIIKGPASPLYGANAFSGVINVLTRAPPEAPEVEAQVTAGARDHVRATARAGRRAGPWAVRAAVDYEQRDGFSNRVPAAFLAQEDPIVLRDRAARLGPENLRSLLALHWTGIEGLEISASGGWVRSGHVELLTSDTTWHAEDADEGFGRLQARLTDEGRLGVLELDVWLRRTRLPAETVYPTPTTPYTLSQLVVNDVFEAQLQRVVRPFDGNVLTLGGAWRVSWLNAREIFGSAIRVTIGSLFLQDEYRLHETLDLALSLRWDVHTASGSNVSPRAALVYAPSDAHTIRLSVGQAFRNPTHVQNYAAVRIPTGLPPPNDVSPVIGDRNLRAERQATVQLDYESSAITDVVLAASAFFEHAEDLIVFIPPPTSEPDNYRNTGNVDVAGGEAAMQWRLASWLRGYASYAFVWAQGDFEGVSPKHQGDLGLRAAFGEGWSAAVSLHAQGRTRYVGPAAVPERETPAYALVRARLAYRYDRAEIALTAGGPLATHHQDFPRGAEIPWEGALSLSYRF